MPVQMVLDENLENVQHINVIAWGSDGRGGGRGGGVCWSRGPYRVHSSNGISCYRQIVTEPQCLRLRMFCRLWVAGMVFMDWRRYAIAFISHLCILRIHHGTLFGAWSSWCVHNYISYGILKEAEKCNFAHWWHKIKCLMRWICFTFRLSYSYRMDRFELGGGLAATLNIRRYLQEEREIVVDSSSLKDT